MPSDSPYANVAIFMHSQIRYLLWDLARELKERHGSQLHLYCKSPQEEVEFRNQDKEALFASINNANVFEPATRCKNLDERAVFATANVIEETIGETYNTLAVTNRHVGRGYALGGFYHPRHFMAENTSYIQMVHAYNDQLNYWITELREKQIRLVIAEVKELAVVSRAFGIPYRSFARSRYKNYHYWSTSEFRDWKQAEKVFPQIQVDPDASASVAGPYAAAAQQFSRVAESIKIASIIKFMVRRLVQRTWWWVRRYQKRRGYWLRDEIAMLWRQRRDIQRLSGPGTVTLRQLEGRRFVFYPLHTEPELSLGQVSPEFYFQLGAISAISRDLPAGVLLVVKESLMGAGRRPKNFYDQITRHKNVVMLNIAESGAEVVQSATAVVTIAGTAGFEAAVAGIPVIVFGQHNAYNFLDHVFVVDGHADLKQYLRKVFSESVDLVKSKVDGARFLESIKSVSFDLGEFRYSDRDGCKREHAEAAYLGMIDSM